MDLANIGFRAQTGDLDKADQKLKKLETTGGKTEKQVNSMGNRFKMFGRNASAAVASVDGPLGGISSRISALTTVATAGGAAMTAFALAVTGFSFAISKGVNELDSLQVALAKSNALVKVTGSAAGKTGEQLAQQAQDIAFATLASVDGISKAQGVMQTFKAISGDTFDRAINLTQDWADVMGGDAKGAALQLGKALNDPASGYSALARAGVRFTDQQIDQIKVLTKSGQMLQAQNIILEELEGQMGGVARAIAGTTLSGSLDTMGQAFDNFTVRLATNVGALEIFKGIVDKLSAGIIGRTNELSPDSANQAFEKALDLQWQILEVEQARANLPRNAILAKAQHDEKIKQLNAERQGYLDYAKTTSESENKILTARSDAILAAAALAEANAKAAKEAKKIEDAKPFEKWAKSINDFQTPLEKATSELVKIKGALSTGGLDFTGGAFEKIASLHSEINKLNETTENTSYTDWIEKVTSESTTGQLQQLQDELIKARDALMMGDIKSAPALEHIDAIEKKINGLKKTLSGEGMFNSIADSAKTALGAVQGLSAQGSKEYAAMGVAIQAVSAVQAIFAVLNQASGDPYTAFGRMAAMAGSVASLGFSVGGLSGSVGADKSAEAQASQGLTAWGDKSESIANSIDITANATEKLVGINTGMLNALTGLKAGLDNAATMAIRGVSSVDTGNLGVIDNLYAKIGMDFTSKIPVIGKFLDPLNFIPNAIGKWLGGSSGVTDSGIQVGGSLGNITADGFQDTEYKKWRFGSKKMRTDMYSLGGDINGQFSLAINGIANSVGEAAKALGISSDVIESKMASFEIATTRISLKDLSAEDQQAEISAVFSSIFDGLAVNVVPFAETMGKVGEGFGETLVRIATQVQVAEVLVSTLGVTLSDKLANPQLFATIADNLTTMVGGIEEFANKTSSFISNFAPEAVKFEVSSNALTKALADVGLTVPATTDGFWALMGSLNGTTAAGQAQIAALLNNQDVASDYYSQLEKMNADSLSKADGALNSFNSTLAGTSKSIQSAIKAMFGTSAEASNTSLDAAIQAAQGGNFTKAMNLDLGGVGANENDFSSLAEFELARANTGNKLAQLADLTGSQKTTADLALHESQQQTTLLTDISAKYEAMRVKLSEVAEATANTANQLQIAHHKVQNVRVIS